MENLEFFSETNKMITKAVWAIDPSESQLRPDTATLSRLRLHLGRSFDGILPVFVCSPDFAAAEEAHDELKAYLQAMNISPVESPKVLYPSSLKRVDWVDQIIRYGLDKDAELIILTSRGRSSLVNFFSGSFAHELIKTSPLPVLLLNPRGVASQKPERVMFVTDFSPQSKKVFFKYLSFVENKARELLLFHAISFPVTTDSLSQSAGLPVSFSASYLDDQMTWAKNESTHWIKDGLKMGIHIRFHAKIEESSQAPGVATLAAAEMENVSMIGLSHQSMSQTLIASQKFELWICGPKVK